MADKFDIEAMRANRDAGTPGPWDWESESGEWDSQTLEGADSVLWWDFDLGFRFGFPSDKDRIASVPDMESEIERLTAELALAVEALEAVFSDHGKVNSLAWTDRTAAALASIKDKANE